MEKFEYVPPGTNSQLLTESFGCQFCSRSFKNQRGLSQYLRCCRKDKQGDISNLNSNNNANFQGILVSSSCSDFVQDLTVNSNDFANVQPSTKHSNDAHATRTQSSSSIQPESTYNQRTLPLFHPMPVSEIGEHGDSAHTSMLLNNDPKVWGIHSKKDVQMVISAILRRSCVLEHIYASYRFSRKEIYCRDDSSYQCLERRSGVSLSKQ